MTGNTKVWRAPLAGLASVAMIATMGVAASTANAQNTWQYPDVKVTLDFNGGFYKSNHGTTVDASADGKNTGYSVNNDGTVVTLTDARNKDYQYADGVFPDLYSTYGRDQNIQFKTGARRFSGWYTEKSGGQAVAPDAVLQDGTTLYAHWSQGAYSTDESEGAVKFDTDGKLAATDSDGLGSVVQISGSIVTVRLQDGDKLADWQVPSEDVTDNQVFDHWDGGTVDSAEAGDTLTARTVAGTKVAIDANGYDIYKDGETGAKAPTEFDVPRGGNLAGYQAVNATTKNLAVEWTVNYGGTDEKYDVSDALQDASEATVKPVKPGKQATVVRVHKTVNGDYTDTSALRYFVAAGESFEQSVGKSLEDVTRPNTQFLGWYDADQEVFYTSENGVAEHPENKQFFDKNLILSGKYADDTDPVAFDFTKPITSTTAGIDLLAGYTADAKYTTITLDPNYSGADVLTVKIYEGKTIGEQLPTVTRDGYTLNGWWDKPTAEENDNPRGWKLDTSRKADPAHNVPQVGTYYAHWTADSKDNAQKNGLLNNLSRFYVVKNDAGKYVVSDGSNANFVKTKVVKVDGKDTFATSGTDLAYTEYNPGYVKTSYEKFVEARKSVVSDLKKELKLSKDASIDQVYKAVKVSLSAEKADTYNRKLANILVGEADFPDVNTSDTDSHTDSIQFMYNQGIVKGYADGTFGYGAPVARVDFIVWLYRAAGSPAVDSQASFTDVNATTVPNQEFRDAIAWAAANKITTGYADGTFAPYARIARQDAAAFIYRAAGSPNYIEDYNSKVFADVTPGDSANHSKAVLWANNNGVVKGFAGSVNRFAGLDTVARQDAAAFLARAIQANLL